MNLSILARASILSSTLTSRTLNRTIPHRPISSSSLSYTPTSPNPKTPLFLRPPIFTATLTDLKKFQTWAKTLASSVGSSFTESDNGPCSEILHRELNWLIQDSVQTPDILSLNNSDSKTDTVVELRAELGDLYLLWKQRVEERRPFQYVVGCEHWRDLVLSVEEGVLIPRPETELMVDLVEGVVKERVGLKRGLWVDLGTGSGAIGIGIGRLLGDEGRVVAVDVSPVAVQVALFNVRRYGLEDKVSVKQGSWFEPLSGLEGQISGLVSNPPYIPSGHISGLQAEVGRHEPILALDGGEDGMSDLLHLCNGAASMLEPGGFFAFETNGEDQCRFLVDHMESVHNNSFCDLRIVPDFAGVQRFVTGFRS
ncbi:putative peptide chain release factor N(5)-glutamine methyltransferase [Helianthus annuus]|nr:putative peptide chain release factor N(5)-glutamine methyltransferase [Helianthus annuus]KAJ0874511.1 putative peptide chain release factor N(5)-glutamine methyltransferase [Helianthus annuus]